MISEKLNASKTNNLLSQSKSMSIERHEQELSLDQLGDITAGSRVGFVVRRISTQGNVRRPYWLRPTGIDVGPVATQRRRFI
ncbi:hypothetical protein PMIT1306_01074 [Prochlorococcus sp. MIT 1306]|nr:hypothetical protein PMIT1306_01074 [Prochlorococcus sp. MIT 1306]